MTQEEIVAVCVKTVEKQDYVTFVELMNIIDGCGVPTEGQQAITLGGRPNTLLWAGMSQEAVDIVYDIVKQTDQAGASVLMYMVDGGMLNFPVVKRFREKDYVKERWLPVCFRPKGSIKR